jgi:hypothetical protein
MGRLKNLKHEHFAKNLIKYKGNQTRAYAKTYPDSNSPASSASLLVRNGNVRQRVFEILQSNKATRLPELIKKLNGMTEAERAIVVGKQLASVADNPVRLDALKTIFKLYGMLGGEAIMSSQTNVQFNIDTVSDVRLTDVITNLSKLNDELLKRRDDYISP